MTQHSEQQADPALVASLAVAFREVMASLTVPEDLHREHHEFIKEFIEREKARRERQEKLKTQVWGWFILGALGALAKGAYQGGMWLKDHIK